ncbi:MAG: hypothetical protein C5B49_15405 [Bdellovibrio sp.]|nr:MAG: hypothetical protein C5B49_15405 [Bdellovibrio sp.]
MWEIDRSRTPLSPTLVTGFLPFAGNTDNVSEKLLAMLKSETNAGPTRAGLAVDVLTLPVEYGRSFQILRRKLYQKKYQGLLMLGQASGRRKISLEQVALNWADCELPDEAHRVQIEKKILKTAPAAHINPLSVRTIYRKLRDQKFPVELSTSAGAYVCNELYFRVLHAQSRLKIPWVLFVHLPQLADHSDPAEPVRLSQMRDCVKEILRLAPRYLVGAFATSTEH